MLSSFARLKYPNLIYASVASSAPVRAKYNYFEYNEVVTNSFSIKSNSIGGSNECIDNIAKGHEIIGNMINTTNGRITLTKLFTIPNDDANWLKDINNQRLFAGNGVALFDAQDNNPNCDKPACDISSICQIMLNNTIGNEVDRLAEVAKQQEQANIQLPYHQKAIKQYDPLDLMWLYQTCTEFAFYQTCLYIVNVCILKV